MNRGVLDASAILAILFQEPGAENLTDDILDRSVVSTVNLAEVQSKLVKMGHEPEKAWNDTTSVAPAEDYTAQQAKIAGTLIRATHPFGLSLGGRSCLALAIALKAEVYTTEKLWKNLKLGIPIHVIR
jgi:ribonuclease VapC